MAETVTVTETVHTSVKKIHWAVMSSSSGVATQATTNVYDGKLITCVTNPGTTAPTDDWDMTITDSDSVDLLCGNGADRDTADTEVIAEASMSAVAGSVLTLNVANAGDSKVLDVYLYIR